MTERKVSCDRSPKNKKHNSPGRARGRMSGFDQEAVDRSVVST